MIVAWSPATVWIAGAFDGTWRFGDLLFWWLFLVVPVAFVAGTFLGGFLAIVHGRSAPNEPLNLNGRSFLVCLGVALWAGVAVAMGLTALEIPMMIQNLLGAVLLLIFSALAILHVYWAFGGRWGLNNVVPEVDGEPVFRLDFTFSVLTLIVAALLATAGGLCAVQGQLIWIAPCEWSRLGMWCLSAVFALRAIGEFRLVGFFKRVKGTTFAMWDTRLFSPLCLTIAVLAGALAWLPL